MHGMLKELLRRSIEPRFGDDILVFWLERQSVEEEADAAGSPSPDPREASSTV
jgi:hypothetical protein